MSLKEKEQKFIRDFDQYSDALFCYCNFRVNRRERAVGHVQEAFRRTWQHISSGNEISDIELFLRDMANTIISEKTENTILSLNWFLKS